LPENISPLKIEADEKYFASRKYLHYRDTSRRSGFSLSKRRSRQFQDRKTDGAELSGYCPTKNPRKI